MTATDQSPTGQSTSDQSPTGPAWAAIIAAALGCATFGLLADMTEASEWFKGKLNFYNPTGDLSGKSTLAVVVWIVAWILLHLMLKRRTMRFTALVGTLAVILVLASLAATFPPVFEIINARVNHK